MTEDKLITAPATTPIVLADVKAHFGITDTHQDAVIPTYIDAAVEHVQEYLGTYLITQTWELALEYFPTEIEVQHLPVQSITSIKYYDTDGVEQTLAADQYSLDDYNKYSAWVLPAYGVDWPSSRDVANTVRVRYVVGYGDDGDSVPADIKMCLYDLVNFYMMTTQARGDASISTRFIDWKLRDHLGKKRLFRI